MEDFFSPGPEWGPVTPREAYCYGDGQFRRLMSSFESLATHWIQQGGFGLNKLGFIVEYSNRAQDCLDWLFMPPTVKPCQVCHEAFHMMIWKAFFTARSIIFPWESQLGSYLELETASRKHPSKDYAGYYYMKVAAAACRRQLSDLFVVSELEQVGSLSPGSHTSDQELLTGHAMLQSLAQHDLNLASEPHGSNVTPEWDPAIFGPPGPLDWFEHMEEELAIRARSASTIRHREVASGSQDVRHRPQQEQPQWDPAIFGPAGPIDWFEHMEEELAVRARSADQEPIPSNPLVGPEDDQTFRREAPELTSPGSTISPSVLHTDSQSTTSDLGWDLVAEWLSVEEAESSSWESNPVNRMAVERFARRYKAPRPIVPPDHDCVVGYWRHTVDRDTTQPWKVAIPSLEAFHQVCGHDWSILTETAARSGILKHFSGVQFWLEFDRDTETDLVKSVTLCLGPAVCKEGFVPRGVMSEVLDCYLALRIWCSRVDAAMPLSKVLSQFAYWPSYVLLDRFRMAFSLPKPQPDVDHLQMQADVARLVQQCWNQRPIRDSLDTLILKLATRFLCLTHGHFGAGKLERLVGMFVTAYRTTIKAAMTILTGAELHEFCKKYGHPVAPERLRVCLEQRVADIFGAG
ncbi:hypothetical protein B0T21DRAFT_443050 [Apiosordaria backusii]|uniref:Uncharacterized protein n=1 Tax=Apiosordaria backusii TaxID=314023 RepID=A0AA40BDN9_9PEZI|nr:hypothetical protein B0T21DRAFT_443050 [Apiosordaria backusii]